MHAVQMEQQAFQNQLAVGPERKAADLILGLPHILTPETGQTLKRPCFDIWRWEPKEMVFLMEHMYHDLGIIEAMNISPVTLRKFLVSIGSS